MAGASPLSTEQGRFIDERLKIKGRQVLGVGRQLAHTSGPYGFGAESIGYDVLTEVSAAKISTVWGDWEEDVAGVSRTNKVIPVIAKGFKINGRQLAASQMVGTPLDTSTIDSAIYKVRLAEDDLLIMGKTDDAGTSYTINGFYKAAANAETTSDDFGTEANVYAKLALAEAELQTDSIYPPYNLVLANTQYNQLLTKVQYGDRTIKAVVEERIEGRVIRSPDLATDTGMLMADADQGYFDIAVGVDLDHKSAIIEPKGDLEGFVYETLLPRIWETNAICTLTNI